MKRFIATLALLAGLTHAAPITMVDVPDTTALYDSSDPFAIGVSTAAYTSATNANARLDALMLGNAATVTNIATYVTAQHANRTDNPHSVTAAQVGAATATQGAKADTAIQPATLATHTNLTLANGAHGGEADTLATAAARGGFAGTETIAPLRVNAQRVGENAGGNGGGSAAGTGWGAYGVNAGSFASGDAWMAFGYDSGLGAVGDAWVSIGYGSGIGAVGGAWVACGSDAGVNAVGDFWGAYGKDAGSFAVGNYWGAYGRYAGAGAIWTNSSAYGNYAGYEATGNNRWYGGTYAEYPLDLDPAYVASDIDIYSDNGQLNLGRTGALTNALPNQLRGRWQGNGSEFTGMTVSQIAGAYPASNPSNFVTAAKFNFTNGTTMADGVLNGTNGFFFVPLGSTNRYWILGGQ